MDELKKQVESYWTQRAGSFSTVRKNELRDPISLRWLEEMHRYLPQGVPLRILDVGTGTGYFAILLAGEGHALTGIDLTAAMLAEAEETARQRKLSIDFRQMDAQALDFPNDSFDVIVTRNLTWNLTDPVRAYREWRRVLRPGGAALIFDANWYAYLGNEEKKAAYDRDRANTAAEGVEDHGAYPDSQTMEDISRELPMTLRRRPQWDLVTLLDLGFSSVYADTAIGDLVWSREEKINYASTPGFLIRAVK